MASCSLLVWILLQFGQIWASYRYLDTNNNYRMDWTYSTTNITFTLTVNTTGWIGLGFSPDGKMAGSDIVTAYVDSNGSVTLQDRFATAEALPAIDAQQDYHLLSGSKSNGQTIVQFTRLLDTCDSKDAVIKSFTTKVLYSYGVYDAVSGLQYHGATSRGYKNLYLLSSEPAAIDVGNDTFSIDAVPQNVNLPTDTTTYWCSIAKFPNLTSKYHVVKFEPVIASASADIVHHILMYTCTGAVNLTATSYNCYAPMSDGGNNGYCTSLLAGWALGGEATYFPAQTGYAIGGGYGPQYVLYQTHYSNMMQQSGRVDASYIRLTATARLRQYDAGMLETGIVGGILVPPQQSTFKVSGYCADTCLSSSVLPSTGINIFATMMHSHLLGRRVTLRQFRAGLELPYISDDPYYDPGYQETRILDNVTLLLPGDALQTVCTYDSTSRVNATLGGLTTQQEMCLSFIYYYPKIDLANCQSGPTFTIDPMDSIYSLMGKAPNSFNWMAGTAEGLVSVSWTTQLVQAIQSKYTGSTGRTCEYLSSQPSRGMWSPPSGSSAALTNTFNTTSAACTAATLANSYSSTTHGSMSTHLSSPLGLKAMLAWSLFTACYL